MGVWFNALGMEGEVNGSVPEKNRWSWVADVCGEDGLRRDPYIIIFCFIMSSQDGCVLLLEQLGLCC